MEGVDAARLSYLADGLSSYAAAEAAPRALAGDGETPGAVARKVADLLLADGSEPTRLQAIVEREFAKLLGAAARTNLAASRKSRPGRLATALVDPLGLSDALFRSHLIAPDREDKLALATFVRVANRASGELGDAAAALEALQPADRQAALADVADALWTNRAGASKAARRIAAAALQQTADRVRPRAP